MTPISVIIPTYNRRKLLIENLLSIFSRSDNNPEVIVVDDGSTDGSLDEVAKRFPAVITLTQERAGPGAARNLGVKSATGEYVAFLDSDDVWFPWSLSTYQNVIDASGAEIVFGKPRRFHLSSELAGIEMPSGSLEWLGFCDYFSSGDEWRWWGASSFVVKRQLLEKVGFSEIGANAEDADLLMKLGHGHRVAQITNPPTFGYREHAVSEMKNIQKTLAGIWDMIRSEENGCYPGGADRKAARLKILGRHIRPVILECLKSGPFDEGRRLLRSTIGWHLSQGRWRFLSGALFYSLKSHLR